jgi:transaldolase
MEFFIDTADINEIRKAKEWGILDGVTTNPSLMLKSGRKDLHAAIKEICQIAQGPVSAEVTCAETDYDEMIKQAHELAKIDKHVVIKIPMFPAGIRAIKTLASEGIKTNCTLIFSANQALIAAKAGATYVSPFVGRLDDAGQDGMLLVEEIRQIFDNYEIKTKILAASLRHPIHVKQAAMYGADVATIPFSVLDLLFKHPLTEAGQKRFTEDWRKLQEGK